MGRTKVDNETVKMGDRNAYRCRYYLDGLDVSESIVVADQIEGRATVLVSINQGNKAEQYRSLQGEVEVFIEAG